MLAALASFTTAFQTPSKLSVSKVVEAIAPVLAAGVLVTGAMPAFAGDADAGEKIFSGNCAACHAGGQNVIMPEKTLERQARACTSRLQPPFPHRKPPRTSS